MNDPRPLIPQESVKARFENKSSNPSPLRAHPRGNESPAVSAAGLFEERRLYCERSRLCNQTALQKGYHGDRTGHWRVSSCRQR